MKSYQGRLFSEGAYLDHQVYYRQSDVDAAIAAKDAELSKLVGMLRECRDILRSSPAHQGREYVTLGVAVNKAIDAHQEPK